MTAQEKQEQVISALKEETSFTINHLTESDGKYKVSGNVVSKDVKKVSQDEYNKVINGESIKFRNRDWVLDDTSIDSDEKEGVTVKSDDKKLQLVRNDDDGCYCFEYNSTELADYTGEIIEFDVDNVSEDLVQSYEDKVDFVEFKANVINGTVDSIIETGDYTEGTSINYFNPENIVGKVWQGSVAHDTGDKELVITDISNDIVTFNYYSYRNDSYIGRTANLSGNYARFLTGPGDNEGYLILTDNEIIYCDDTDYAVFSSKFDYDDFVGKIWSFDAYGGKFEVKINSASIDGVTFELMSNRHNSYGPITETYTYETVSQLHFNTNAGGSMVDGVLSLSKNTLTLRTQESTDGLLESQAVYETTDSIKYSDYIGKVWRFDAENDGFAELVIDDISNGQITFDLYSYRNNTYERQTADFTYDTASVAHFTARSGEAMVDGTITLGKNKITLYIQDLNGDATFNASSLYESSSVINYDDYIGKVWKIHTNNGFADLKINNITDSGITFELFTYRNNSYGEMTVDFAYDSASVVAFDASKDSSRISGIITLKNNNVILNVQSVENDATFANGDRYETSKYIRYNDYAGKSWRINTSNGYADVRIHNITDEGIVFELFTYRNNSYGEILAEFDYDTASVAHFVATKDDARVDGTLTLGDGSITLTTQEVVGDGAFESNSAYTGSECFKYSDFVDRVWIFEGENDNLIQLKINDIGAFEMSFELMTYRNKSYSLQTVDFAYDTASNAYFTINEGQSSVEGVISFRKGKVGLNIQNVIDDNALTTKYYETSNSIKLDNYDKSVWSFGEYDSYIIYIDSVDENGITFNLEIDNLSSELKTAEFSYETLTIAPFDTLVYGKTVSGVIYINKDGSVTVQTGEMPDFSYFVFVDEDEDEDEINDDVLENVIDNTVTDTVTITITENTIENIVDDVIDNTVDSNTMLGDLNLDGVVDDNDFTVMFQFLNKEVIPVGEAFTNADINGDGEITAADRDELARMLGKTNE